MYNNQAINKDDKSGISDEDQIFLLTLKEIREDNKSRIIGILKEHPEGLEKFYMETIRDNGDND